MKIIEVEIHHAAEDLDGSICFVVLSLDLDDRTHRKVEVKLPSLETLTKTETP